WSEKGTVRGTIGPLIRDYGVGFFPVGGFADWTEIGNKMRTIASDPRPYTILYVGDCDPSGMCMSEDDLPKRFASMALPVTIRRLGLFPEQARLAGLASFPATDKRTDSRYSRYVARYGDTCWELDAMNPVRLRDLIAHAIEDHITDQAAWRRYA